MTNSKQIDRRSGTTRSMPTRDWRNKARTLFGWIDGRGRGEHLNLSAHSGLALARENNARLRAELADRLEAAIAKQGG